MIQDPLDVFAKSSLKITPSLIEYEVGSEIELFVYNYLRRVFDNYDRIVFLSFFDAYSSFVKFLIRSIGKEKVDKILKNCELISIYPKGETDYTMSIKNLDYPTIIGKLRLFLDEISGRTIILALGLDFYSIFLSEKSFISLFPRIAKLPSNYKDLSLTVVLNVKIFSDKVKEIINSFSFNIARLGIENVNNRLLRYFILIRTIYLNYNLFKWYYDVIGDRIIFRTP